MNKLVGEQIGGLSGTSELYIVGKKEIKDERCMMCFSSENYHYCN